jgi:hypothetical protein
VQPEHAERRDVDAPPALPPVERRTRSEYRVPFAGDFARGWLCFETAGEKRRLSPFPDEWADMTDSELWELCGKAEKAGKREAGGGKSGPTEQ